MPGVEAIRKRDWVFEVLGRDGAVFARPSGCHKLFVGRLVDQDSFAAALAPTRYDQATLVLLAEPKEVGREWRVVAAGNTVVAASQYAVAGVREVSQGCPDSVRRFAE